MIKRSISLNLIIAFVFSLVGPYKPSQADILNLPSVGSMVNLSQAYEPALIKGITVHKDNPFLFDFIVDSGHSGLSGAALKSEGDRLVKYFFACLTIPEKDLWVNLSPYEKDRMIPEALGQTALGRDLLAQDYILKQLTASLIYPEKDLGHEFWDRVYAKAQVQFGTTQIPVNTFNKVWILADKATVYEHGQTAFVIDGHLKVMLDEDYLSMQNHQLPESHSIASQIIKQIILPEIEKEVNQGKNFALLRQIFYSQILATWYKKNLKEALLNQVYTDQSTVKGVNLKDPSIKEQIYEQYLKAYKKGVFNYIKGDSQSIPRKYFSGGYGSILSQAMITVNDRTPGIWKRLKDLPLFRDLRQIYQFRIQASVGSRIVHIRPAKALSDDDIRYLQERINIVLERTKLVKYAWTINGFENPPYLQVAIQPDSLNNVKNPDGFILKQTVYKTASGVIIRTFAVNRQYLNYRALLLDIENYVMPFEDGLVKMPMEPTYLGLRANANWQLLKSQIPLQELKDLGESNDRTSYGSVENKKIGTLNFELVQYANGFIGRVYIYDQRKGIVAFEAFNLRTDIRREAEDLLGDMYREAQKSWKIGLAQKLGLEPFSMLRFSLNELIREKRYGAQFGYIEFLYENILELETKRAHHQAPADVENTIQILTDKLIKALHLLHDFYYNADAQELERLLLNNTPYAVVDEVGGHAQDKFFNRPYMQELVNTIIHPANRAMTALPEMKSRYYFSEEQFAQSGLNPMDLVNAIAQKYGWDIKGVESNPIQWLNELLDRDWSGSVTRLTPQMEETAPGVRRNRLIIKSIFGHLCPDPHNNLFTEEQFEQAGLDPIKLIRAMIEYFKWPVDTFIEGVDGYEPINFLNNYLEQEGVAKIRQMRLNLNTHFSGWCPMPSLEMEGNPYLDADQFEKLQATPAIVFGRRNYSALEVTTALHIILGFLGKKKMIYFKGGLLGGKSKVKIALWDPDALKGLKPIEPLLIEIAKFYAEAHKLDYSTKYLPGLGNDIWSQDERELQRRAASMATDFRQWDKLLYDFPDRNFIFSNGRLTPLPIPKVHPDLKQALIAAGLNHEFKILNGEEPLRPPLTIEFILSDVRTKLGRNVIWNGKQYLFNAAMAVPVTRLQSQYRQRPSLFSTPGGIDLNTSNGMQWQMAKDGNGVEMNVNAAMIAQMKEQGVDKLVPIILKVTSMANIWPLTGFQAPSLPSPSSNR